MIILNDNKYQTTQNNFFTVGEHLLKQVSTFWFQGGLLTGRLINQEWQSSFMNFPKSVSARTLSDEILKV